MREKSSRVSTNSSKRKLLRGCGVEPLALFDRQGLLMIRQRVFERPEHQRKRRTKRLTTLEKNVVLARPKARRAPRRIALRFSGRRSKERGIDRRELKKPR